jgi:hypothetical protein
VIRQPAVVFRVSAGSARSVVRAGLRCEKRRASKGGFRVGGWPRDGWEGRRLGAGVTRRAIGEPAPGDGLPPLGGGNSSPDSARGDARRTAPAKTVSARPGGRWPAAGAGRAKKRDNRITRVLVRRLVICNDRYAGVLRHPRAGTPSCDPQLPPNRPRSPEADQTTRNRPARRWKRWIAGATGGRSARHRRAAPPRRPRVPAVR